MSILNKPSMSYVFSPKTLDQAIKQWVTAQVKNSPKKKELFLITEAALPWFMQHLNPNQPSVYMFTYNDMLEELVIWQSNQLIEYPQQQHRIEKTCELLKAFFTSKAVQQYKMIVSN